MFLTWKRHSIRVEWFPQAAEELDGSGKRFLQDRWERSPEDANAGYGITRVLEGGDLLEKVGEKHPGCVT